MGTDIEVKKLSVAAAGAAVLAGLLLGTPSALADPVVPGPPPPPPAPDAPVQAAAAEAAPPAEGVPHLVSPENLPPDTTMTPVGPQESRGLTYLRELLVAVQTQEVSGKDALLLLTQQPLDPAATPPPGVAPGPTPPAPGAPLPPPPPPPAPPLLPLP
jgi:resuscitation-promoting factor RpfA